MISPTTPTPPPAPIGSGNPPPPPPPRASMTSPLRPLPDHRMAAPYPLSRTRRPRQSRAGAPALAAGDGRQDRDLGAVGHRRLEAVEVADVLAGQEDVDEPAQAAVVAADARSQLAVLGIERLEHLADGAAGDARL